MLSQSPVFQAKHPKYKLILRSTPTPGRQKSPCKTLEAAELDELHLTFRKKLMSLQKSLGRHRKTIFQKNNSPAHRARVTKQ